MKLNPFNSLKVSEQFYSIQGEGKTAGTPAFFVRLTACNLLCEGSWVCDTIPVWKKGKRKAFSEIIEEFGQSFFYESLANRTSHLVWTGGEPLLQQKSITAFMYDAFYEQHKPHPFTEVETNGTIKPNSLMLGIVNQWNISPKLSSSGAGDEAFRPEVIQWFLENLDPQGYNFKFVVEGLADIKEMQKKYQSLGIKPDKIMLMPAVDTQSDYLKMAERIVQHCISEGYKFSPRIQVEIWDKTTGV